MNWKNLSSETIIALAWLCFGTSSVAIAVYVSNWYNICKDFFFEPMFPSWKHLGGAVAGLMTASLVLLFISLSFKYANYIAIVSGVMQLPVIVLMPFIIKYTTSYDSSIAYYKKNFYNSTFYDEILYYYDCVGLLQNTSIVCSYDVQYEGNYCCDKEIESIIYDKTTLAYGWMLGLYITWISSFLIGIPLTIFLCKDFGEKK